MREFIQWSGSSPRVRGKHVHCARPVGEHGLIPACAGKTGPGKDARSSSPAHPRVCGENRCRSMRAASASGSSPRVRGKREHGHGLPPMLGLIPACAGKTSSTSRTPGSRRAHPRVCGENLILPDDLGRVKGSSPRVRGKPARLRGATKWTRLIPACAGKTPPSAPASTSSPAHPRVCGENSSDGFPQP